MRQYNCVLFGRRLGSALRKVFHYPGKLLAPCIVRMLRLVTQSLKVPVVHFRIWSPNYFQCTYLSSLDKTLYPLLMHAGQSSIDLIIALSQPNECIISPFSYFLLDSCKNKQYKTRGTFPGMAECSKQITLLLIHNCSEIPSNLWCNCCYVLWDWRPEKDGALSVSMSCCCLWRVTGKTGFCVWGPSKSP